MIYFFKRILYRYLPAFIYEKIANTLFELRKWHRFRREFKGERVTYGSKNPNAIFYVIRRNPPGAGLMSNYLYVLGHIKIAIKRSMIPIVDMVNYRTLYNENESICGTMNPWEYYFEQPNQLHTLDDVYQSKNVVLSSLEFPHHEVGYTINECRNKYIIKDYYSYIFKYIKLNKNTEQYINDFSTKNNFSAGGVLGVSVRGTDYVRLRPAGHPVQPDVETIIETARKLMEKWSFTRIYLSSEEEAVLELFRRAFPNQIIAIDRMRVPIDYEPQVAKYMPGECNEDVKFKRIFDKYNTGLEYLAEMVLLTKCDFLLCAMTSGNAAAIFMNGGEYLGKEIFDLGVYPVAT